MDSFKKIARNISLIENKVNGFEEILLQKNETANVANIIGITGSPGAGKSTLVDCLIQVLINDQKKVAVLCVDPSSPFNMGALLGDRIRMNKWYNNENVFIRSMASRKSLGGLSPMIIEVTEYLKTVGFDHIIIETVGVGQNEIDIAGLADVTVVVVVPEGGDEIQTMKSGIMEVADIFVVNKCDRPGANQFVKFLHSMLAPVFNKTDHEIPIVKTIAEKNDGIDILYNSIKALLNWNRNSERKYYLLAEKAYHLIQSKRMESVTKEDLAESIKKLSREEKSFNLYQFVKRF
jgi:LAO/AO transport system kinase